MEGEKGKEIEYCSYDRLCGQCDLELEVEAILLGNMFSF